MAASNKVYIVMSFNNLFTQFPKANNYYLFINHIGTFSCNYITRKLQEGIWALGYKGNYIGYSFRRGVAISARIAILLQKEI